MDLLTAHVLPGLQSLLVDVRALEPDQLVSVCVTVCVQPVAGSLSVFVCVCVCRRQCSSWWLAATERSQSTSGRKGGWGREGAGFVVA